MIVEPTVRRLDVFTGLLSDVGSGANLVADAHLAALSLEHNAAVVSYDNDFSRIRCVRWRQPSAPPDMAPL